MKYLLLFPLLMFAQVAAAQTQADYEQVMGKFMQFYNNNQLDSLLSLCSQKLANDSVSVHFSAQWLETCHKDFGEMTRFAYVNKQANGTDSAVVCKVFFTRFYNGMAMSLDKKNHFEHFWFLTSPSMKISEKKRIKPSSKEDNPTENNNSSK